MTPGSSMREIAERRVRNAKSTGEGKPAQTMDVLVMVVEIGEIKMVKSFDGAGKVQMRHVVCTDFTAYFAILFFEDRANWEWEKGKIYLLADVRVSPVHGGEKLVLIKDARKGCACTRVTLGENAPELRAANPTVPLACTDLCSQRDGGGLSVLVKRPRPWGAGASGRSWRSACSANASCTWTACSPGQTALS